MANFKHSNNIALIIAEMIIYGICLIAFLAWYIPLGL